MRYELKVSWRLTVLVCLDFILLVMGLKQVVASNYYFNIYIPIFKNERGVTEFMKNKIRVPLKIYHKQLSY